MAEYNSKEGIDSTLPSHPSSLTILGYLSCHFLKIPKGLKCLMCYPKN